MRRAAILMLFTASLLFSQEPKLIVKPDAFPTLVNPNCSHCVDEAKRRKDELKDDDRVLCWTRGKYDGGAVPLRFFLHSHRVISDTYGVFVHDPEAGYARGFKASVDFTFHGWRNGVMVMKHKDGTLFSCLTGVAFDGPRKGQRLESWPTIVSDWGWVMKNYPGGVAYHMHEKFKPIELPGNANEESVNSRGKADERLRAEEMVLGVELPLGRSKPRVYRLADLEKLGQFGAVNDVFECGTRVVILWQASTRTAAAYLPEAQKFKPIDKLGELGEIEDTKTGLVIEADGRSETAPFIDKMSGSRFDIAGRCIKGELKGYCLRPAEAVMVKWFAWAAEYPSTTIYQAKKEDPKKESKEPAKAKPDAANTEITGTAEFLKSVPKKFATFEGFDEKTGRVKLLIDGEKEAKEWPVEPDAEIKRLGWWSRIERFKTGDRVWIWFKIDRKKAPATVLMLADEMTEQDIHGVALTVKSINENRITLTSEKGITRTYRFDKDSYDPLINGEGAKQPSVGDRVLVQSAGDYAKRIIAAPIFEKYRAEQQYILFLRWSIEGLPGTVTFTHVSGEADLMLDHEAMRWARSLKTGDKVKLQADPPIEAIVKSVAPWRERTQVRVVIGGVDLADLRIGQRILLRMKKPPTEVLSSDYPPDIEGPKGKDERIDWFLASIYCTCKIRGDTCTGHFYTLASCNPNTCGGPNAMRAKIGEKIDAGLSNKQIWDDLKAEKGPTLVKPHLLP